LSAGGGSAFAGFGCEGYSIDSDCSCALPRSSAMAFTLCYTAFITDSFSELIEVCNKATMRSDNDYDNACL
jgi:hypothetical protein